MFKSIALIFATVTVAAADPTLTVNPMNPSDPNRAANQMAPTDPQIAMIAVVTNNVDIDAGKLAIEKTPNKSIKAFAEQMVRDHSSVNEKATALVKKLGVTPEESATSKNLKAEGDKMMGKLKALSGSKFDRSYVDNEVTYHVAVLDMLDKTLIPNAKNTELKSLLESVRPVVASHLEHARTIQNSLER